MEDSNHPVADKRILITGFKVAKKAESLLAVHSASNLPRGVYSIYEDAGGLERVPQSTGATLDKL